MKGKEIVVWFSCGAASAVAAKLTVDEYGKGNNVRVVNTPVVNEHEDNRRFLKDIEQWIGQPIELAVNPKYPSSDINEVFEDRKYMSGPKGAPCTVELKKGARYAFEKANKVDYHVLGFTSEERKRFERFSKFERENTFSPLIEQYITKAQCFERILDAGIELPAIYKLGYPNANCIGCVKASSPTYWNLVRRTFPEVFAERAKVSREIGCRLVRVKGKRIFLDELDPDAKGNKIKSWECGIFCDTK